MRWLLVAAGVLSMLSIEVHAAYANASPPAGWSSPNAGSGTPRGSYRAAANESWGPTNNVRTNAALNVGGRATQVPASMRMAANAGRFAARFAFGNPLLFAGGLLLPLAYDYFMSNDHQLIDGIWQKKTMSEYTVFRLDANKCSGGHGPVEGDIGSLAQACQGYQMSMGLKDAWGDPVDITCVVHAAASIRCNRGPYGVVDFAVSAIRQEAAQFSPATLEGMESHFENIPVPPGVPDELPKTIEWPTEDPVLNPNDDPEPVSVPYIQPMGDPVPVPNTNPQQWHQPHLRITPRPTEGEPWRVDIQPRVVPVETPEGNTGPVDQPNPDTGDGASGAPAENPDLCALHPEIIACQKMGTPPAADALKTENKQLTIEPDSGWQFASNSCPAPKTLTLSGKSFQFSLQSLCDFAAGIRPVIVGMAYLSSMLIFFGMAKRAS